jgi:mRNA interferase RelE/StbE
MDKLKKNPQGIGVKKLVGMENLYRLRVGDYRVVYTLDDTILLILVVKIAHRKDVYKNLG